MGSMGSYGIYGIPCPKCKYLSKGKWKASTWGILSAMTAYNTSSTCSFCSIQEKKKPTTPVLTHLSGNKMWMSWIAFSGKSTIHLPHLLAKLQTAQKLFFSFLSQSIVQDIFPPWFLLWVAALSPLICCHNNEETVAENRIMPNTEL